MKIVHTVFALVLLSVVSRAQESKPEDPTSLSPDKKWEFRFDSKGNPEIARAGTTETVLQLYNICSGGPTVCKPPVWAPDSKRFAFHTRTEIRYQPTSFYQLKGDKWEELPSAEAIGDVLDKAIAAQVKKKGRPKNIELRLISNPIRTIRWSSPDTALVYGSMNEVEKGNVDVGFSASFLFTLKFDPTGECKIVKTERLSEKERRKYEKDSEN
ncbi:MAG TPA: hypothetical protein VJS88_08130 [Chthoniobacterales bacterium]|nr:hypothetical protein [Chthoniobacterales bacterium]